MSPKKKKKDKKSNLKDRSNLNLKYIYYISKRKEKEILSKGGKQSSLKFNLSCLKRKKKKERNLI